MDNFKSIPKDFSYSDDVLPDLVIVQRMALRYSNIAGVYLYALDRNGDVVIDMTCDRAERDRLTSLIGRERLDSLFHRVSDDELEVQATEDTSIPNIKIAAVSLHIEGVPVVTWVLVGVLGDDSASLPGACNPAEFSRNTTMRDFESSLDVTRDVTKLIVSSHLSEVNAEAESRRSRNAEQEIRNSLKRITALSEIVALLDSNDAIEVILNEIMRIVGEYMGISSAMVCRSKANSDSMDIVAEWDNKGWVTPFDSPMDQKRFPFMSGDKAVIHSFDTETEQSEREMLGAMGITAVCAFPIQLRTGNAMYSCFLDASFDKTWSTDEVKFLHDANKVLHSILTKRIQKNSLASSYASLEAILDNVGSAIFVRDIETGSPLFANSILKSSFQKEIADGTLAKLFDSAIPVNKASGIYEVDHREKSRWYDLHYTDINWVDGRKVSLCAAYDVTDKKNYQHRIEQQAYTDFLTGLYNRMCCERDLAAHIDFANKNGLKGALLYLDLDDFKHINDGLGHQYGDVLLKAISHSFQRIDGIENTCYRMGGDEFVIIVPPASYNSFNKIIDSITEVFSKPWFLKDADYYCTMSMGIVEFPESGENVQDLIKKADIAMYEAKKSGKNRVARYSENIVSSSNERLDMEKNMRDAMSDNYSEFEVYYQPIVDILDGNKCIGAEALIRWNSNTMGFINPTEFIPLAEYLGLINPIGNHVMKEACATCKYWNDNGHPDYKVNVNLSVVQLLQTDIVDIVRDTIEATGINPRNLTLEVTESLAINDMERMKKILGAIKTLGVKIALDDFGTGYSSLNHIREIPFDVIKVDQGFVKDLAEDAFSQAFVKMVAELAETLGVNICVEGIENDKQFAALVGMKVKMVQGFYFDRPMPRDQFISKYVK